MHQHEVQNEQRRSNANLFVIIGLVAATALYYFSSHTPGDFIHDPKLQIFKTMFISIILEALPFILIGVLVSALLQVYVPDRVIRRLIPRNPVLGVLVACLLGVIFPICECGMVPAVRQLIRRGMPSHAAATFILAGPIFNPIVFWSTWTAFRSRPEMVFARMGLAVAVASVIGLIVYRFVKHDVLREQLHGEHKHDHHEHNHSHDHHSHDHRHSHDHSHQVGKSQPFSQRLIDLMSHASSEFFDMGKYLMVGASLVGLLQTFIKQGDLVSLGQGTGGATLLMMTLGFLLSLCSTSDAFVAQSFMTTFSHGSLIAFMVFGPMLNLKSLLMMLAVFRKRFVLLLAVLTFSFVFIGSLVLETWVLNGG